MVAEARQVGNHHSMPGHQQSPQLEHGATIHAEAVDQHDGRQRRIHGLSRSSLVARPAVIDSSSESEGAGGGSHDASKQSTPTDTGCRSPLAVLVFLVVMPEVAGGFEVSSLAPPNARVERGSPRRRVSR